MEDNKKYGLFTSITMIIGIVIGSGIFFKADDVLKYTDGNVLLGILIFIIAAIAIIFGSLSMAQLATRTDKPGGIITYAEEFVNKETASAFGWFQIFLYMSTIIAVVTWVAALYIYQLFGIEATLMQQILLGFAIMIIIFALNILSAKLGGYFQNLSMIIKLIPLIIIAIFGFIKGNPVGILSNDVSSLKTTMVGTGIIAAFGPIAFSFDGWIVSTTISNEIKNSKRNLPIALIISPIIVLICYIAYFVGISVLVGPEQVLELGNDSVNKAAQIVFGETGAKIMLIFVVISVLGTCNGLILGLIRMPYSLAIRNMLPFSDKFAKESKTFNKMPLNSALLALCICTFWTVINYFYTKSELGDISEIAICISYLNYTVLYVVIIKLAIKGEIKNKFMGYFVPVMAIIGSLIILSGSINKFFIIYLIICFSVMGVGYFYCKNKK